jgi:release factor glutamine methyltransferase
MDIRTALRDAATALGKANIDAPANTARILLSELTGKQKEWLVAHGEETLDERTLLYYASRLQRVIEHEPLFYVLGHREFYGLDFLVDKRVLIPRPETEMLVELALRELRIENEELKKRADGSPFSIMDIGTGSGAVPIAIAKHAPHAKIIATDISKKALDVAVANAQRLEVEDRITFVQADLLAGLNILPTVLTANLPYVTRAEIDGLPPEIQDHEPRVALDGGEDGLDLVRRLLRQIKTLVYTPAPNPSPMGRGILRAAFLEFGASQGAAVLQAAQKFLPTAHSEILKDLAKLDRVLTIRFNG